MNNIIICRFYFSIHLGIITTVDEGHHLNVLEMIDISCDSQPTAYTLLKGTSARKGPNKSIQPLFWH